MLYTNLKVYEAQFHPFTLTNTYASTFLIYTPIFVHSIFNTSVGHFPVFATPTLLQVVGSFCTCMWIPSHMSKLFLLTLRQILTAQISLRKSDVRERIMQNVYIGEGACQDKNSRVKLKCELQMNMQLEMRCSQRWAKVVPFNAKGL